MNYTKCFRAASVALMFTIAILLLAPSALAAGKYKTLHKFKGVNDGSQLEFGLTLDHPGNLYGTTVRGGPADCGIAFKLTPTSEGKWTESVLYSFKGGEDACGPNGPLVFDQAGNLYGTSWPGGHNGNGVVFKLTPQSNGNWSESVVYNFCSLANCSDGANPAAGLIFDQAGNLYGTTFSGGPHGGIVFKLTPNADGSWSQSVLYNFCSLTNCIDGSQSLANLTFDATGNLYGTTFSGGTLGLGVVFKLAPNQDGSWTESVLHSFCGLKHCRDGSYFADAGVIVDSAGAIYGTTAWGGTDGRSGCPYGCGVVFKLTQNSDGSWKETVLHQFTGGKDGASPYDGVTFDQKGNLYGTTQRGGNLSCGGSGQGCGVVFRLEPNSTGGWKETVLHVFADKPGAFPSAGVVFDTAGNLYSTTFRDTVFEITP